MYIAFGRARLKAFLVFQGNTQPPHIASKQEKTGCLKAMIAAN